MNLKKLLQGVFAAALLIGVSAFAQEAAAEAQPAAAAQPAAEAQPSADKPAWIPSVGLSLQLASRYLSDGNVVNPKPMIFPDFNLGWNLGDNAGIYAGIWAAIDYNRYHKDSRIQRGNTEEVDYYIGAWYTVNEVPVIKALNVDFSWTYWDYPNRTQWPSVGETQRVIALDLSTADFNATDELSYKFGFLIKCDYENDEWQLKPYVAGSYAFTEKLSLNTKAELFWQNAAYTAGRWVRRAKLQKVTPAYTHGFTTLVFSADLNYQINDYISVGPFAKLAYAIREKIRNEVWGSTFSANSKSGWNNLYGVQISANF